MLSPVITDPREYASMSHCLLNTREAAALLGVSKAFLERDRWAGARIPFVRIGTRAVRYRREDLERYLDSRLRRSTSEHSEVGT